MKKLTASFLCLLLFAAACGSTDSSGRDVSAGGEDAADSSVAVPTTAGDDDEATNTLRPGEPLGARLYPIANLDVTITHPAADKDVSYTISCLGDTATIIGVVPITAEHACTALADEMVARRLVNGEPNVYTCTEQYGGPDIAMIVGTYNGDDVNARVDRTGGCDIIDWDDVLGGILPPALGVAD